MDASSLPSPRSSRRAQKSAFSLIEVTLALGIVGFAFVALFGMLPMGLRTFEGAIDATIEIQIAQAVITSARQDGFSELPELSGEKQYYDSQGNRLASLNSSCAYEVETTLRIENGDLATPIPEAAYNKELATLRVTVQKHKRSGAPRVFTALIANNEL